MNHRDVDHATDLLAMAQDDFDAFVADSLRSKRLSKVVIQLNQQVLRKDPSAKAARKALKRIGFPD